MDYRQTTSAVSTMAPCWEHPHRMKYQGSPASPLISCLSDHHLLGIYCPPRQFLLVILCHTMRSETSWLTLLPRPIPHLHFVPNQKSKTVATQEWNGMKKKGELSERLFRNNRNEDYDDILICGLWTCSMDCIIEVRVTESAAPMTPPHIQW